MCFLAFFQEKIFKFAEYILKLVPRWRIELPSAPCKDAALPLDDRGIKLVAGDRFELPMLLAYETGVVTTLPAI